MSKINIILAFICGAFLSAILSYVIYNKKMIEPWEDYKGIERSIEEVSNFKKYSMPNIKLLHRGSWLKGEVEKIGNIKVVIDRDKAIDSLVKEKSNGGNNSERLLMSYYSAYIDAIIAMNNQELETGYIIYNKLNIPSDKGELTDNKDNITDVTEEFTKEISNLEIARHQNSKWGNFVEIYGELRQSLDIVNIKNKINGNGKKVLKNVQGRIEFKDVHFAFNNKKSVLNDFNLIIRPYEKVGIIGNSGVGKSTLAHLLLGNFQVKKGEIKIDNIDTSSCTLNSLRKNISLIPQDVILFNRSVYENIKYGCFNATDKEIFEASNNAFAHKFISELDNGYDTIIGERGIKISTGQRQRIIIARALLKNAPIFIFDEATSALDNITEEYIKKSITDIMMKKKKTVIVIAHKLSSVKNLDRIIVMKNGKIIEDGEHKILVQINNGYYRKLYESQNNI